jgi:hypothetical protein
MNELIRYTQLESGIHELVFLEKTRASVDYLYEILQGLYLNAERKRVGKVLIDLSGPGLIPMSYMFQQSQAWFRRNHNDVQVRVAILYPPRGVLPIAKIFINRGIQTTHQKMQVRLESIHQREAAIAWLLGDVP